MPNHPHWSIDHRVIEHTRSIEMREVNQYTIRLDEVRKEFRDLHRPSFHRDNEKKVSLILGIRYRRRRTNEKGQIDLIDDTHPKKILTYAMTKTRLTTNSDESEEIIWNGQEESEKREGRLLPIGMKISREELIESEDKWFGIELTLSTEMTRRTETEEVTRSTLISLQTKTTGKTRRTSIEIIIVEKTFHSALISCTDRHRLENTTNSHCWYTTDDIEGEINSSRRTSKFKWRLPLEKLWRSVAPLTEMLFWCDERRRIEIDKNDLCYRCLIIIELDLCG